MDLALLAQETLRSLVAGDGLASEDGPAGGSSLFTPRHTVWPEESQAPLGQVLGYNCTHAIRQLYWVTEYTTLVAHALLCAPNFTQHLQRLEQAAG